MALSIKREMTDLTLILSAITQSGDFGAKRINFKFEVPAIGSYTLTISSVNSFIEKIAGESWNLLSSIRFMSRRSLIKPIIFSFEWFTIFIAGTKSAEV